FFLAGVVAQDIAGERSLVLEVIFRALLAALLFAIYLWMLTAADGVHRHRIAALGLPCARGWLKQFAMACAVGCGLAVAAVAPIAVWGNLSFAVRSGFHVLLRAGAVV